MREEEKRFLRWNFGCFDKADVARERSILSLAGFASHRQPQPIKGSRLQSENIVEIENERRSRKISVCAGLCYQNSVKHSRNTSFRVHSSPTIVLDDRRAENRFWKQHFRCKKRFSAFPFISHVFVLSVTGLLRTHLTGISNDLTIKSHFGLLAAVDDVFEKWFNSDLWTLFSAGLEDILFCVRRPDQMKSISNASRRCLPMLCQRNLLNFFSIQVSQNEFLSISAKNLQTMIINRGWYESGSRWLINQWSCRWAIFIQPFRLRLGLFRDLRIRSMNINELSNSHRLLA